MLTPDNFHMVSFVLQEFTDGISDLGPESAASFGVGQRGMESNVDNISPPSTNANFRKVIIALVGQNLRDSKKHSFRHAGDACPRGAISGACRWRRSVSVCHGPPVGRTQIGLAHGTKAAGNGVGPKVPRPDHAPPLQTFGLGNPDPLDQADQAVSNPARW